MKLREAVSKFKPLIENEYRRLIREYVSTYGSKDICRSFYLDLEEFLLRGGKRLRPISLIMAYYAVREPSENELRELIKAALSVELLHNASLIHDDIIDQDVLRRGKPTFHVMYEMKFKHLGSQSKIYGIAFGILGGDELFNLGFMILSRVKLRNVLEAIQAYSKAFTEIVNGEILDLTLSTLNLEEISIKEYLHMVELKTGGLFKASLIIGSILAGADKQIVDGLAEYARNMAIAFQIRDDILDIFGEEKKLGKPIGSDIREKRPSIINLLAINMLKGEALKEFKSLLGRDLTREDIERARKILRSEGILKAALEQAEKHMKKAIEIIDNLNIKDEAKEYFKDLAQFVITRKI